MYEVEQKYRVEDLNDLRSKLSNLGAAAGRPQQHWDTYYNHPSRDFAETGEAFRIRRIDGVPLITYKGPKLPGRIKARRELEWRLDPGDPSGDLTEELLQLLGFRPVASVSKERQPYSISGEFAPIAVVIDHVENVGNFAELELIVAEKGSVEGARDKIQLFSERLGLRTAEPRSYLEMLIQYNSGDL